MRGGKARSSGDKRKLSSRRKGGETADPLTRATRRQARLNRERALRPKFRADREEWL